MSPRQRWGGRVGGSEEGAFRPDKPWRAAANPGDVEDKGGASWMKGVSSTPQRLGALARLGTGPDAAEGA